MSAPARSPLRRLTMIGRFLAGGFRDAVDGFVAHCQTTGDIADRLGLDAEVRTRAGAGLRALGRQGRPGHGCAARQIEPAMRSCRSPTTPRCSAEPAVRRPRCEMLARRGAAPSSTLSWSTSASHTPTRSSPTSTRSTPGASSSTAARRSTARIAEDELDDVLAIFADYADLKSPWYLGHSRAVADAGRGGRRARPGCRADRRRAWSRRAGLVHRLGATGVSTGDLGQAGAAQRASSANGCARSRT